MHAGHNTMGVHGMVLFAGADGLFASHLPLFRAPHDRQILLELAADPRVRRAASDGLWTIEPDRFELAQLLPTASAPLKAFRATVYRGHFERGGTPMFKDVRFRVRRVVFNRPLQAGAAREVLTYDRVGRHLVKRIEGRPDIDHIVALGPGRAPDAVSIPRSVSPTALEAALARHAPVRATVYFELDDLR